MDETWMKYGHYLDGIILFLNAKTKNIKKCLTDGVDKNKWYPRVIVMLLRNEGRIVRIEHPLYWNRTQEEYVHAQSQL